MLQVALYIEIKLLIGVVFYFSGANATYLSKPSAKNSVMLTLK
jgi:hypothetical protein